MMYELVPITVTQHRDGDVVTETVEQWPEHTTIYEALLTHKNFTVLVDGYYILIEVSNGLAVYQRIGDHPDTGDIYCRLVKGHVCGLE